MIVESIDDPRDPRLDDYRDLRHTDLRAAGILVAEGRAAVTHLLAATRFAVRSIVTTPSMLEALRGLLAGARGDLPARGDVPVRVATHGVIREVAGFAFHRGCLAAADRGPALAPADLVAPPGPRTLVILEGLADPENVGGAFRNAMAFGAGAALLSPGCADPFNRKAIRVSSGGTLRVPWASASAWPGAPAWPAAVHDVRAAGYTVVALTPDGAHDLRDLVALPGRRALLVGSESPGLSAPARAAAHLTARIAMAPGVDSLNVATATGIALHHLFAHAPPGAPRF